jgi:hypothetical protein
MRPILPLLLILLSTPAFATLLLEGSQERGHPDIEYDPTKPPTATIGRGTAFPDPSENGVITRTFRISNLAPRGSNNIDLRVSSSTPEFTVTGLTRSLSPQFSDTFQISYSPSSTKAVDGLIVISTSSPSQPQYPFEVRGAGGRNEARFENAAGEVISNRPGETNTPLISNDTYFGSVPRGSAPVTKDYFLVNRGSLPIDFIFQNRTSDIFSSAPNGPLSLHPGQRQTIIVTMDTDQVAPKSQFEIGASDAATFFISFTVAGEVTGAPEVSLQNRGSDTPITSANFGTIEFLSNDQDFSLNGLSPRTLAPGESDAFSVTFTPTFGRQTMATLTLNSNAINDPVTFTFRGTASLPPLPAVRVWGYVGEPGEGTRVTFGGGRGTTTIRQDETFQELIVIRNTGNNRATFGALTLSPGFRLTEPLPQSLEAGGELYRTLEYRPERLGSIDLSLQLEVAELTNPVIETANRRLQVLPPLRNDLRLQITEVRADEILLTIEPTTLDEQGSYRLMQSSDLRQWQVAQSPVNLFTTQFTFLQIPRDPNATYFRVERIPEGP